MVEPELARSDMSTVRSVRVFCAGSGVAPRRFFACCWFGLRGRTVIAAAKWIACSGTPSHPCLVLLSPLSEYAVSLEKAEKRAAEREERAQRRETVAMEMEASAMKHLDLAAAERHAFRRPQQTVRTGRDRGAMRREKGGHCWGSNVWARRVSEEEASRTTTPGTARRRLAWPTPAGYLPTAARSSGICALLSSKPWAFFSLRQEHRVAHRQRGKVSTTSRRLNRGIYCKQIFPAHRNKIMIAPISLPGNASRRVLLDRMLVDDFWPNVPQHAPRPHF